MPSPIVKIDHIAVTTSNLDQFVQFYKKVLGARVEAEHELDGQISIVHLSVGGAMMNVHRAGHSYWLVARAPTPGALDICFRWNEPIATAIETLGRAGVEIIKGPVGRICSDMQPGQSVYFRDADGNLVELLSTVADRS